LTSVSEDSPQHRAAQFFFGLNSPWWIRRRWLRFLAYPALRLVDSNYIKWSRGKISYRRFARIKKRLDREYPPNKYSASNLVGREKEHNVLLDAFRLHVLRHPLFLRMFNKDDLPKAICLTGQSGTGKTFITLVSLRQMLLEAHQSGILVSPIIIRGSDIYSEYYGQSVKQLSRILQNACSTPSIVYFDEFQSFGRKTRGETGAEIEDTRVQDELNRWLDKILNGEARTLVIMATNAYERIREDIRRRLTRIDLDSGITRNMRLAVIEDLLRKEHWHKLQADEILQILEKEAAIQRSSSITPSDVQNVFREVKKSKEAPMLETIKRNFSIHQLLDRSKCNVELEDFAIAAKKMKLYMEREKSEEVMEAVYVIKPKENRADIGGLHDIKNKILNHIALAFNPKMAKLGYEANCRFLLVGPPGTGKTTLALAAAAENDVNFIRVRGGELMSGASYMGEPEKRIKELFALARRKSPCMLFLDEADAIFWGIDSTTNKILAQVKAELSEITPEDRIVVIAASNKEHLIDPATRDRFEPNIYYIHPPLNDEEWNEVVSVHLAKYKQFLHPEVAAPQVTKMFRRQRILSPRGVAETIAEAHRLWASELAAAWEMNQAIKNGRIEQCRAKYDEDLARSEEMLEQYKREGILINPKDVGPTNYMMRLRHFERAIGNLESLEDRQRREIEESLILTTNAPGVSYGLYTTGTGYGGTISIECSIRPLTPGEPPVSVTGQALSTVIGQTPVPDESVKQSAENATEAVRAWLWKRTGLDLSEYHVHFQLRSLLEGAPGSGVSGPSAGFAMSCALVSELSNIPLPSSKVMTGTIGVKLGVGPVGGVGGYGKDSGKVLAILKAQKVKITDLVLPKVNYINAVDEMKTLESEGISVHPINTACEGLEVVFGLTEDQILSRIVSSLKVLAKHEAKDTQVKLASNIAL